MGQERYHSNHLSFSSSLSNPSLALSVLALDAPALSGKLGPSIKEDQAWLSIEKAMEELV